MGIKSTSEPSKGRNSPENKIPCGEPKQGQGDGGNAGYPMAALTASGKGDVSSHATFHVLKTGNFEQGWVGETEAGRVWGSPIHGGVPHSQFSRRLCHWLLPKLLTRLFLGVQLHRGQLEMVLRAARTVRSPAGRSQPPECRELTPGSLFCSLRCLWCSCAATSPRWMGCSCPSCSSPRGSGCPG